MRTSPPQVAFSSGELDPLLARRFDYRRFQTGLARCRGFLPLPQGGFTRAPGTIHRGEALDDGILIPFQFAANDALILEFTARKMRVWRYGSLIMADGNPYELTVPYDLAALRRLQWVQSADVIYLADGQTPIHVLSRFALDNWSIEPAVFDAGPFKVQNLRRTRRIQASAATGTVTLTANWSYFGQGHVGCLMRLTPVDNTSTPLWTSNESLTVGDMRRYGDRIYELVAGSNAGENPPIHHEGVSMVDNAPTKWRFISDDTGIVRITQVASATSATAEVLRAIPRGCVDDPTYRWSEGAWSSRSGYPGALEIFDQRLVAAASTAEPRTIWFSAVGDYSDFGDGTEADEAFGYSISGDGSVNRIVNLRRGRSGLHVFALGEEYVTRAENRSAAIGPTNVVFETAGSAGSNGTRPITPDGDPIFVARDGQRVMLLSYDIQRDGSRATRLSLPAQHLGEMGFEQIAWQAMPSPCAWIRLATGDLAAMIYDPSEEVLGWAVIPLAGGEVRSIAIVPGLSGRQDSLTMIVRRQMGGALRHHVEEQSFTYGVLSGSQDVAEANHLFCATEFVPDERRATFVVPHLAGCVVSAWTDLGVWSGLVVDETGTVTLPAMVARAWIGLFDATHEAVTLDIQAAAPDGNTSGRLKRVTRVVVAVHRSAQGRIALIETAPDGAAAVVSDERDIIEKAPGAGPYDAVTGLVRTSVLSGNASEVQVRIRPFGGAPLTITSIVPTVQEAGG